MSIINIDESKCVGCNSCVRVCPSLDANQAIISSDGTPIIKINDDMCIKCGACIKACTHGARYYIDDTEEFMRTLESGQETALIVAPAIKIAFNNDWEDLLAYLRRKGVKLIYDVSFGADICTWVHFRYLEKNPSARLISQPCAAIVNYVLKHNHDLMKSLSPGQSPMMCTAIYLRKYAGFTGKIGAISPCIAKKDEFKQNGYTINFNVTLEKLREYLKNHNISYIGSAENKGFTFDGPKGFVGATYPKPGGLKENLLLHAPNLGVLNSEGTSRIYHELDQYVTTDSQYRPPVFDVLNCEFGCNGGPALGIDYEPFKTASISYDTYHATDKQRETDKKGKDAQFAKFDVELKIEDFLRDYRAENTVTTEVTEADIKKAFERLHKENYTELHFDCHSCGYKSCRDMAIAVAKGHNVPENCRQYNLYMMNEERYQLETVNNEISGTVRELEGIILQLTESIETVNGQVDSICEAGTASADEMAKIGAYMSELNTMNASILEMMKTIDVNIENYAEMTNAVKSIAGKINLLSLNASIESARAGEAGRAFGVVAQNIRNLSDSSKKSVENAQENEDSIRSSVNNVNDTVAEFSRRFDEALQQLDAARARVKAVSDSTTAIVDSMSNVKEISGHIDDIAKRTSQILG